MKQQVRKLSAALFLPFLMGAATVTTDYSTTLNYQVKGKVISHKSSTLEIKSSRKSLMGKVVFNYEVICNGCPVVMDVNRPTRRYYTVNYRMDLYPQNQVKYANGVGGWFTETGNAAVSGATVKVSIHNSNGIPNATSSFKNNLAFSDDDGASIFKQCHPYANSHFFPTSIDGAVGFQQSDASIQYNHLATTAVEDSRISARDINADPTVDSNAKVVSTATNYFNFVGRPRNNDTHEYVSVYGCYRFTSDNANDKIVIDYTGTFVVAENSFWGDEVKQIQNTVTLNWQRPAVFD
ncbi:MAG: hypothetical protein K6B51_00115 [Bacilli bacterium]|nr:hypothetical protein [Bacilli bacterium]